MDLTDFLSVKPGEKPLDNLKENGGYTKIFRNICCIGDSLTSGEIEHFSETTRSCYDVFDISWGKYIERATGSNVSCYSAGGMTCTWYLDSFQKEHDLFNKASRFNCYIIALGANDFNGQMREVGSIADVDVNDYHNNKDSFTGDMGRIISKYKEINPDAYFFLVTMPRGIKYDKENACEKQANCMRQLAEIFDKTYVIDLNMYGPIYDEEFCKKFFYFDHLNPAGYYLTSVMISSYIDFIIRNNFEEFKNIAMSYTNEDNKIFEAPIDK